MPLPGSLTSRRQCSLAETTSKSVLHPIQNQKFRQCGYRYLVRYAPAGEILVGRTVGRGSGRLGGRDVGGRGRDLRLRLMGWTMPVGGQDWACLDMMGCLVRGDGANISFWAFRDVVYRYLEPRLDRPHASEHKMLNGGVRKRYVIWWWGGTMFDTRRSVRVQSTDSWSE